ncbi:hypothetical protein UF75_4520 [Desulfosporosinus sp. I2]|uniref:hypothetical protein n=1 Tax=Desulfosporosinus sp. I2 TaxID=1617025 RepID=UPI0005ED9D52|nr:hypothetical protein [Desulfosporosinus sp. I2]KJR45105.1 hypothetical protein UF75_4520 [Desulfosporosinus sp. I2]
MSKKIITFLSSLVLILGIAMPAFADSSVNLMPVKVIKNPAITDPHVLFQRAVNGISDLENKDLAPKSKAHISNNEDGISKDVKVYSTTQLLKEEKFKDGKTNREYATTSFAVVKASDLKSSGKYYIQGSLSDDEWDSTGSVNAYSTIRWSNVADSNGVEHITMAGQTISGGWSPLSGFTVKNKTVTIGQIGVSSWGGYLSQSTPYSISDSSLTFSKTASSSWKPVLADDTSTVGCSQTCTIYRGTSNWTFTFTNNKYGDV